MIYKTFGEIVQKVQTELDLLTEDFIQTSEFQGYVNDAINVCEAEIHKLGIEDIYFRTKAFLPLTTGVQDYALPTNIYHNKILAVIYSFGATIYTIKRMRSSRVYEDIALINQYNSSTDFYQYLITNNSAAGNITMQLVPPSRETSTTNVTVWYIRTAERYTGDDTALCDMPEIALNFIYSFIHWKCFDKERLPEAAEKAAAMLEQRKLMVETLTNMVPDADSVMEMDFSMYQDFS